MIFLSSSFFNRLVPAKSTEKVMIHRSFTTFSYLFKRVNFSFHKINNKSSLNKRNNCVNEQLTEYREKKQQHLCACRAVQLIEQIFVMID